MDRLPGYYNIPSLVGPRDIFQQMFNSSSGIDLFHIKKAVLQILYNKERFMINNQ